MSDKEVIIYGRTNPPCPFCNQAKAALDAKGLVYTYKDITNPEAFDEFSLLRVRSVPQIVVDNVNMGGFDNILEIIKTLTGTTVKNTSLTYILKRDGSKEDFDETKLNKWAEWAANSNVAWSDIVFQAIKQVSDGCTSSDIQEALIKVCVDKLDPAHLDMAARLLVGKIYKEVFGSFNELPTLPDFYYSMVDKGLWIDMDYSEDELEHLSGVINHSKDFEYKYQSVKQITDKYVLQDKVSGDKFESPQFMYMGVAMANMMEMPKERRLEDVEKLYLLMSTLKLNAPTPILGNTRTKNRGLASCAVLATKDTADSIGVGPHIAYKMTNANAGLGAYVHCRSLGDEVRGGSIEHTGKLPYYKLYSAAVKATKQPQRGGSMTMFYNILDPEIEDLLKLKHVTTPLDKQNRDIDYGCVINKLFVKKALKNEDWMLVSVKDAPDLWEAMYDDSVDFETIYNNYVSSDVKKRMVSARELAITLETQWHETGRVYKMWADAMNDHTPFKQPIYSSNLCLEVALPTSGFDDVTSLQEHPDKVDGEIALCFLAALVAGRITDEEYEEAAYYATLMVDNTIDLMDYPFPHTGISAKSRRSIGVGIVNLADKLAVAGHKYTDLGGKQLIHDHAEMHSYYLHKASLRLAKERGVADWMHKTKYPEGWLPIDTYNRNVDTLVSGLKFDWEELRQGIIAQGGIRHSVLEAHMPAESSAQASNSVNGVYPMRDYLIIKGGSKNKIPCFVPHYEDVHIRANYQSVWDIPHKDMVDLYALLQKFTGQAISSDFYFNPSDHPNNKVGTKQMLQNLAYATKMGMKTQYYMNTKSSEDSEVEETSMKCDGGGCEV